MYRYGMKFRGFSPGCQPIFGLVECEEDPAGIYFNILTYDRRLTQEEIENFELVELQKKSRENGFFIEKNQKNGLTYIFIYIIIYIEVKKTTKKRSGKNDKCTNYHE